MHGSFRSYATKHSRECGTILRYQMYMATFLDYMKSVRMANKMLKATLKRVRKLKHRRRKKNIRSKQL